MDIRVGGEYLFDGRNLPFTPEYRALSGRAVHVTRVCGTRQGRIPPMFVIEAGGLTGCAFGRELRERVRAGGRYLLNLKSLDGCLDHPGRQEVVALRPMEAQTADRPMWAVRFGNWTADVSERELLPLNAPSPGFQAEREDDDGLRHRIDIVRDGLYRVMQRMDDDGDGSGQLRDSLMALLDGLGPEGGHGA